MFKLLELKFINHVYFKDIKFNFVNSGEESNGPYLTLIIGPNGTGKSQILSSIIEIFNFVAASKERIKLSYKFSYKFDLTYIINNNKVRVSNIEGKVISELNKRFVQINELPIPKNFLASAINLNDRFPNLSSKSILNNPNYQYLGIRSTSNNAFIGGHSKNIIDYLSEAISKKMNLDNLSFLFRQLDLKPLISIEYKAGRRFPQFAFNETEAEDIYPNTFRNSLKRYFDSYIKKQKNENKKSYRTEKYLRLLSDKTKFNEAYDFLFKNYKVFSNHHKNQIFYITNLNFSSDNSIQSFNRDVAALKTLVDLEILSYNKINLQKANNNFQLIQASSGEYHLLTSFLGLFSKIEDDSVILIDEPEISLHPNWQMRYMEALITIFKEYKSCHFIIATHSHFMVSDLPSEKSSILSLRFEEEENLIKSQLLDSNTYGWTPENILYNIFNVATVRNHYFEMDLRNLIKLLSDNSKDFAEIKRLVDKFENFRIQSNDPLQLIISHAKEYLKHGDL